MLASRFPCERGMSVEQHKSATELSFHFHRTAQVSLDKRCSSIILHMGFASFHTNLLVLPSLHLPVRLPLV